MGRFEQSVQTPASPATLHASMLHFRGALAVSGAVRVSADKVSFAPTGWFEKLVGVAHAWDVALPAIERVELRGSVDKRMVLRARGEAYTLGGRDLEPCFDAIVEARQSLETRPRDSARSGTVPATRADAVLLHWSKQLGLDEASLPEVLASAPGMVHTPGVSAAWGWLLLGADGMRFLPSGEARDTDLAWHLDLQTLGPPSADATELLSLPDDRRFTPYEGEHAVRRIRAAWRRLSGGGNAAGGDAGLARNRRATFRAKPPVAPSMVLRVAPPPPPAGLEGQPANDPVEAPASPEGIDLDGPVAEVAPERVYKGELRDLSFEGACLCLEEEVAPGTEVFVELPTLVAGMSWHAKVVHGRHVVCPMLSDEYWLIGVKFEGLLPREREAVEHLVMEFQRSTTPVARATAVPPATTPT
jgi:hypothetical protein